MKKFLAFLVLGVPCVSNALDLPDWKPVYRSAIIADAFQTREIRLSPGRFSELNPVYKHMGSEEAFLSLLAVGYLGERCIESIKPKATRLIVGWLVTLGELGFVVNNASIGVNVVSFRF